MAQGDVTNTVQSGGGTVGAGAAELSRTIIALGVAPGGTVNAMYNISSTPAIRATFDPGSGGGVSLLGEYAAKILEHYPGGNVYCVPVLPSTAGAMSGSVTQVGTGSGAITISAAPHVAIKVLCVTGGAIATATFRFSLDGGTTYGAVVSSVDDGGGTWTYRVPGTFCSLTFAAATYVATKTLTVDTAGTVTNGSAWVGVVTQASSPIDNYSVKAVVAKAGAVGTAGLSVSLDGGITFLAQLTTAATVVIPGTGMVMALTGTFVAAEYYTWLAAPPAPAGADITAAMNAIMAMSNSPTAAIVHVIGLPSTCAGAFSAAALLKTACATASSTYGKNWIHISECPSASAGDTIVDSTAKVDTADTDTAIRAARVGATYNYGSVCVATQNQQSSLTAFKLRRPIGWAIMARYVEAVPSSDVSEVGRGGLDVYMVNGALYRDEWSSSVSLYDAQLNVLKTYPNAVGAYVTIELGGYGWRNVTTDANFQDANAVRVLVVFLTAITAAGRKYLGSRQPTKPDGTIQEGARLAITADLDGVARRTVGLLIGGQFVTPQASAASAVVLATSQLGSAPHRLDVEYNLQSLGFVSGVADTVNFGGILPITA